MAGHPQGQGQRGAVRGVFGGDVGGAARLFAALPVSPPCRPPVAFLGWRRCGHSRAAPLGVCRAPVACLASDWISMKRSILILLACNLLAMSLLIWRSFSTSVTPTGRKVSQGNRRHVGTAVLRTRVYRWCGSRGDHSRFAV